MINQNLFDNKKFFLKDFLIKLKSNRLWVTWTLILTFIFFTFFWLVLIWRYNFDILAVNHNLYGMERLITGGTIRSLAIEGGQWWRIFTYGTAVVGYGSFFSIFVTSILGMNFFRLLKFNEGISGPVRTLMGFLIAYILTGFILSSLGGPFIYGGINILTSIAMGMIIGTMNNHKNQVFDFIRKRLVNVIFFLLIIPLFTSAGDWIGSIFGFAVGMSVMNLIYYKIHNSQITLIFSLAILITLFSLSLVFAIISLPYGLPQDEVVRQTLYFQVYYNLALNHERANEILTRLNWDLLEKDKSVFSIICQM